MTSSRERDIELPDFIKEGDFFTVRATVCFSRKIFFFHIHSYFDLWFLINSITSLLYYHTTKYYGQDLERESEFIITSMLSLKKILKELIQNEVNPVYWSSGFMDLDGEA